MDAKACLRSMRLRTLPLSLAGIVLGVLLSAAEHRIGALTVVLLALTTVCLQVLSNLGACYATLEVRVSNVRAQNLYKSLGFVAVGKRKRYYEDNNEDAFLMVCEHLPEADPDYSEEPWIEKEEEP